MKNEERKKILVVDDSIESINLLKYFLKPAGYELLSTTDGTAARDMACSIRPDIILLDAVLPGLSGFEICEQLRSEKQTLHIPIIMITALKQLKDKIRALEAGADDFISKPFDSVELLARVKSLLRIKAYHDELICRNKTLETQKKVLESEEQLKRELTNLIVHDMKNPLFVIQGNLQMINMLSEAGQMENSEKYTRRIERSSRGLLRMILNLLDISRLEQNTMELEAAPVDLHALLNEAIDYVRDLPECRDKEIETRFNKALPKAFLDKAIVERVLENLFHYIVQNASDHSKILVKTDLAETRRIVLRLYHQGRYIPEKYHEKIFTKLAQTELKNAGFKPARGLGLIFCKMALEVNSASIKIDRSFRRGTGFIIELPVWKHAAEIA